MTTQGVKSEKVAVREIKSAERSIDQYSAFYSNCLAIVLHFDLDIPVKP